MRVDDVASNICQALLRDGNSPTLLNSFPEVELGVPTGAQQNLSFSIPRKEVYIYTF